jgi:DNA-damage-inducible protein D
LENNLEKYSEKIFENIKHVDENGVEFWYAREFQVVLEYKKWEKFYNVIQKAINTCNNSNNAISEHFSQVGKTIKMPKSATKQIEDFKLTRYACYLIVQNGDPRKKIIALGQTHFAIQTRKQELSEMEYLEAQCRKIFQHLRKVQRK